MQAEIFDDGGFEYRYDLLRMSNMDALTNVVIGAKFGTNDYLDVSCAFSTPDDDIVPVVVEFKSLAYVTNGTLRLSAQGLRIWEDQSHIGTPVQSQIV